VGKYFKRNSTLVDRELDSVAFERAIDSAGCFELNGKSSLSGKAQWAFEGGALHAHLRSELWEQTELRRHIFGSGYAVLLVKMEKQ